MNKLVTEFIGTFFLCLTVIGAIVFNSPLAPLAIGSALMVMVYMGGHISGAHYNPAVSLALLMRGKMPRKDFLPYLIAQFGGAIVAGIVAVIALNKMTAPEPGKDASLAGIFAAEILYTFALALVVLNVAATDATKGNSFYGLAIGFTVFAGAVAVGSVSGGAFNPAVGVGLGLVNVFVGGEPVTDLIYYIIGPFIGGALAAVVYKLQHPTDAAAA